MGSQLTLYAATKSLDFWWGGVNIAPPATLYVGLYTDASGVTAAKAAGTFTELSGSGYARIAVPNTPGNWPAAAASAAATPANSGAIKANGTVFSFGAAAAAWGTVRGLFYADAATGGNILAYVDFAPALDVGQGITVSFAVGAASLIIGAAGTAAAPVAPAAATDDAYTRRIRSRLDAANTRITGWGKKMFIGELGIPHRGPNHVASEQPLWNNALDRYLDKLAAIPTATATYWQAGRASSDYYATPSPKLDPVVAWGNNAAGTGINTEYPPGPVLTPRMSTRIGVNLAGFEYIMDQDSPEEPSPSYGAEGWFATDADMAYLEGKGVKLIRLPMMWKRMQPTINGPLDTARLAQLDTILTYARNHGIKVILDNHNYGRYTVNNAIVALTPGTAGYLSDFWVRMNTWLALDALRKGTIFALDLMNEPVKAGSAADWESICNTVVNAVKTAHPTGPPVIAPAWFYCGLESFMQSHTTDFAPNCDYYGLHFYPNYSPFNAPGAGRGGEGGLSGNFCATYAEELSDAVANGF